MSAHVLLNLINKLEKRDKCEACRVFYTFFCNELNKFNNTKARIVGFYLSYDIKITLKSHYCCKTL